MSNTRLLDPDRGFDTPFALDTLEELRSIMTDDAELAARIEKLYAGAQLVDLKRGEHYPELLRAKLGLRTAVASAMHVDPASVLPNFGSNGSIDTVMSAASILAPERAVRTRPAVLVATPTYFRNYDSATSRGLEVVEVPLGRDSTFDADAYISAMQQCRPRLAVLVTPNNPTGIAISDDDLLRVVDAACDGTWVMIDRTLVNTRPEVSTRSLLERYRHKDLVILHSFSKYRSMSQHRIGVALFSNPQFAAAVEPMLPLGLSLEACVKATSILLAEGRLAPSAAVLENIRASRRVLDEFVATHPDYEITDFSSNYCLLTLPPRFSAKALTDELARSGIQVMGGHEFPQPNYRVLRIHTGGEASKMERLCGALAAAG